jgi:hypothetical protein
MGTTILGDASVGALLQQWSAESIHDVVVGSWGGHNLNWKVDAAVMVSMFEGLTKHPRAGVLDHFEHWAHQLPHSHKWTLRPKTFDVYKVRFFAITRLRNLNTLFLHSRACIYWAFCTWFMRQPSPPRRWPRTSGYSTNWEKLSIAGSRKCHAWHVGYMHVTHQTHHVRRLADTGACL